MNVSQVPSFVCAFQIAQQFAAKAANCLSQQQFHQLLQFLRGPAHSKIQNMKSSEQLLARKLEQFHATEVEFPVKVTIDLPAPVIQRMPT